MTKHELGKTRDRVMLTAELIKNSLLEDKVIQENEYLTARIDRAISELYDAHFELGMQQNDR